MLIATTRSVPNVAGIFAESFLRMFTFRNYVIDVLMNVFLVDVIFLHP
jgi:hypothetical protein